MPRARSAMQEKKRLDGVGFAPSNERFGILGRRFLFLRTMFKLRQGPIQFLGLFFWPLSRRILFETTQILEPFWFLFSGRELYQVMAFYDLLDLAAQVGPEKMHFVAECR